MNDAELIAALRADRRLTHYQVTTLWAVVARLGGQARGRVSQGELAEDLRISRKTICRALRTLPEGAPVRVEGAEAGVSMTFVVAGREGNGATVAPEVEMTWDSQSQVPRTHSPNAARSWDSQSQVPRTHSPRLERPPGPHSPNAARSWDSQSQVTGVHTPGLSARLGGVGGGSDLQGSGNRLESEENISSDAREREGAGSNGNGRMFCAAGSEATELRLRAQRAVADAFGSGLDHGPPGSWPEVLEVTKRFAEVWGREVRLTGGSPGVRRVVDRLAEGYTVAELCRAIVGSRNDPFFQANGHYQTLHTILRDSGQVDRFMVIADEPPARGSGGKPIQPNHSGINVQKNVVIVEG